MTHADTLRGMAKALLMVGSHERVGPCLAGADALEAIDRVRDALAKIDTAYQLASDRWKHDFDMYEQGLSDAYDHAHTLITEALEGETP